MFFKIRPKFISGKTFEGQDFGGLPLYSEAIAPMIREK